jgi:hypothetical protein
LLLLLAVASNSFAGSHLATVLAPLSAMSTAPSPTPPPGQSNSVLSPGEIRARSQKKIFQLSTEVLSGEDKQSYGTAFVIDKAGLLVTNFHVVSEAALRSSRYKLQLKLGTDSIPATIVSVDVPNDLAIVWVNHTFEAAYTLSNSLPVPGEKLYMLGIPEDTVMTIIEGLFSDFVKSGPVDRLIVSSPLNRGMSGGPVVNSSDEVVGVNDAILMRAQNISIAIPASRLASLQAEMAMHPQILSHDRNQGRAPASVPKPADAASIRTQISSVIKPWVDAWGGEGASLSGMKKLGAYRVPGPMSGMKCWEDVNDTSSLGKMRVRTCANSDGFSIGENTTGGKVSMTYYLFAKPKDSVDLKKAAGVTSGFEKLQERLNAELARGGGGEAKAASYACSHRYLKNSHGTGMLAEYCAVHKAPLTGVYDVIVSAMPTRDLASQKTAGKEDLIATIHLYGFPGLELKQTVGDFLDGITEAESAAEAETEAGKK